MSRLPEITSTQVTGFHAILLFKQLTAVNMLDLRMKEGKSKWKN
nr:MAG TPA: hypothetical protein [Caudoviricetes sp.]